MEEIKFFLDKEDLLKVIEIVKDEGKTKSGYVRELVKKDLKQREK